MVFCPLLLRKSVAYLFAVQYTQGRVLESVGHGLLGYALERGLAR